MFSYHRHRKTLKIHYEIYSTLLPTCVVDMAVTVTCKYGGRILGYDSNPHSQSFLKSMQVYINFFNMNVIQSLEVLRTTQHDNDNETKCILGKE
jgi:hypothetical protein